jgi:hypothetical protein
MDNELIIDERQGGIVATHLTHIIHSPPFPTSFATFTSVQALISFPSILHQLQHFISQKTNVEDKI